MAAYSGGTLTGGFGTDGARWDERRFAAEDRQDGG
jgi:hypothetical protein